MQETASIFHKPLREPSAPLYKFVGGLLVLFGGLMLWFSWQHQNWIGGVTGFVFFVGGMALVFVSEGIEINFSDSLFRNYSSIFGFFWGRWNPLPNIEYVTIYSENLGVTNFVSSLQYTYHDQKLKIALVHGDHQQISVGRFKSKEKALEVGKLLAAKLETKLLDYTQKEPVWLIK